jgi:glutamate synthase domain-containing protein 2
VVPVALLAAVLAAGVVGAAATAAAAVYALRRFARNWEHRLADISGLGPVELVLAGEAMPVRDAVLTLQRAAHAIPAAVPMQSPARDWLSQVRFDPATLRPAARPPRPAVRLEVQLGPGAASPLRLAFPLLLSGMGWGVGVSDDVRQVLAEAGALAGVAVVSGEGPPLPVELETLTRWVWQWGRSSWQRTHALMPSAMIELQVGQASEGGTAVRKPARHLPRIVRRGEGRGELRIAAGLPLPLDVWVRRARAAGGGVPVAVKLPASQHLEEDLALAAAAGVDVVVLDGAGAGTASSPAVLADHLAIPTPVAAARAHRWLTRRGLRQGVSLVVSGRVHGAADVAKLLALGADAVAVGTVALMALAHGQVAEVLPGRAPTSLVLAKGADGRRRLDRDLAAERLANWLIATRDELAILCQSLGVGDVHDLGVHHLVADTPQAARALGIAWYGGGAPSPPAAAPRVGALARDVLAAGRRTRRAWDRLAAAGAPPRPPGAGT